MNNNEHMEKLGERLDGLVDAARCAAIFATVVADAYEACAKAARQHDIDETERCMAYAEKQMAEWSTWLRSAGYLKNE